MKEKFKLFIIALSDPKTYLFVSFFLVIISSIIVFFSKTTIVNNRNINEVLPEKLSDFKIVHTQLERSLKTFNADLIHPENNWFNKMVIEIPEEHYQSVLDSLKQRGVKIIYESSVWLTFLYKPQSFIWGAIGICFILAVLIHAYRGYKESAPNVNVNKYNLNETLQKESSHELISFDDIAGIDEVREQIEEIVDLFNDSSKIEKMGGKIPKGVLLAGPPGTGKTLLAKATASQCGANFLSVSGSEFVEVYVGMGSKRVRELFQKARNMSPCIIFIDEIDSVAGKRGGMNSHDEREQTLNQLLVEMDGFDSEQNILVIAATNQIEKLDPAILRPGRFDRQVQVHLPDINGRSKILDIYLSKTKIDKSVQSKIIAKMTSGFSGAQLANLVNEAILFAAKNGKEIISHSDLVWAKDKVIMGSERKLQMKEEDKIHTAYHEVGHALIGYLLNIGTVSQVSIVPRGNALGITLVEQEDSLSLSYEQAMNQLMMLMGGRVVEKMFFNHLSTGASNDLQRCFNLARSMVCLWGISNLGPIAVDDNGFRLLSEKTKEKIDNEILKIVEMAEKKTKELLIQYKNQIEQISLVLLEEESIYEERFKSLLNSDKNV